MTDPKPSRLDDAALAHLAEEVMTASSLQIASARVCRWFGHWAPRIPVVCLLQAATETAMHARVPAPLRPASLRAIVHRFAETSGRRLDAADILWDEDIDPAISIPWHIARCVGRPIQVRGSVHGLLLALPPTDCPPAKAAALMGRVAMWLGPVVTGLERVQAEARWDPVTGLYNRLYLDECLSREYALSKRHRLPLSLILVDADDFKRINDQHGHPTGDRALREIGLAVKSALRETDIVCRYGGDEFAAVLPHTGCGGAHASAGRIEEGVRHRRVRAGSRHLRLEVSVGAATYDPSTAEPPATLILRADAALYRAKPARSGNQSFGE
jgi:diguanylate cyclase (GGDEF)-like protein